MTVGRDGALQVYMDALDPYKSPQLTLELQLQDFFSTGICCVAAAHNGMVFTGGNNGVLHCLNYSHAGVISAAPKPHRKTTGLFCITKLQHVMLCKLGAKKQIKNNNNIKIDPLLTMYDNFSTHPFETKEPVLFTKCS